MPNKLDFSKDIAMFKTFWKNPIAISFVIVLLVVYTLMMVWGRRKDKNDVIQVVGHKEICRFHKENESLHDI